MDWKIFTIKYFWRKQWNIYFNEYKHWRRNNRYIWNCKKLNAEEALDRLNNIKISELNENLNDNNIETYEAGYVENHFEITSGPNKVTGNAQKISYDVKGP